MKFANKTLGLLLAALALTACGGGGGNGGAVSPARNGTITLTADRTALPVNLGGLVPAIGSPYMASVSVAFRSANGTLEAPTGDATFTIDQPNIATLSEPDDGATDFNEFTARFVSFHQILNNGSGVVFVNTLVSSGTATLTVSAVDPQTGVTVTQTLRFTVTSGVGTAPASVTLQPTPTSIYLPSSGGVSLSSIAATVLDGGGQFVLDPVVGNSGSDNIQFEIVGTAGDARLSSNSVAGSVSGTTVSSHTVHGIATASLQAGDATPQGPVQIRATVDRADNNVTNGIQDPVSVTTSVIVSDGKLYSVKITSPDTDAIRINSVSGDTTNNPPNDPDGTYSLTVSALGLDRQESPVLPGTPIRFGAIDEPVGLFNAGADANRFLISGGDGDPQEGGTLFTAPTGHFQTAGGGAGPGDAVVVFGKTQHGAPLGNEDLESALTVQHVNSQTSLTTSSPFNRNDTTGALVDNHAVLPYIIGRGQHGNITASAVTNSIGVAHATLNYTVSTLGHIVAMWAQGDGIDRVTSGARRVTDAVELVYPGVAPAALTAFPSPIPGNQTTTVTVCITDAQRSPIQGVRIGFQLTLTGGTGSVDGNGTAGLLDNLTGPDGCVDATVTTSGLPAGAGADGVAGTVNFSAGDATTHVDIVVQLAFLSASPTQVCAAAPPSSGAAIGITAYSTSGDPLPGVVINAVCTPGTIIPTPASATTTADGSAIFHVTAPATISGTCTFTTTGSTSRSVSVQVGGSGSSGFSPPCG